MSELGFHWNPVYKDHVMKEGHPECPERLDSIISYLEESGLIKDLEPIEALKEKGLEAIEWVHQAPYIQKVKRISDKGGGALDGGDTIANEVTYEVAISAVEGALGAGKAVIDGKVKRAFCALRPPGHHAVEGSAMGFCIFNNVAMLTRYLQKEGGFEKVLIIDFDVHHGNGTQDIFYEDGSVFYFSTHQFPFFPGTGAPGETGIAAGKGHTLNCPLTAGSRGQDVIRCFEEKLIPAMKKYKPDFILVSAGFDAHKDDPVGEFQLIDDDYVKITNIIRDMAKEYCDDRLISVLEGGYNLETLGRLVGVHLKELL